MDLTLCTTNDSNNTINKTFFNSFLFEINPNKNFNIYEPKLILEFDFNTINSFNYAMLPNINRYYFISSIDNLWGIMWEVVLKVDVLETYKTTILNSNSLLKRNIKVGDYYFGNIESTTKSTITTFNSDKGFEGDDTLILSTIGGVQNE